ncbi:MAG TPA: sorbosone dehydrogenase family protein [Chitinophagaceae bacterium]|jgi:glucose/arabinose dehydrogenase|nr:sorbosone dehydrogenase family protein [Chitinophagaceae bacterium]
MPRSLLPFLLFLAACTHGPSGDLNRVDTVQTPGGQTLYLPAPYATPSAQKASTVVGWPAGKMPVAPEGFTVRKFAGELQYPRWFYMLPNDDVLVAEAATENSANRITLFRDTDGDDLPDLRTVFLQNLKQPLGMLLLGTTFYVAHTDGVYTYPYQPGQTSITAAGQRILSLPAGGYNNHWTRNLLARRDGSKIYVSVGSGGNNGEQGMEHEVRRANILEINPDGTGERIFASGLRNPVGMAWAPGTETLWTAVNERDGLGDELVPDYLTSVQEGGFYGWPYAYFGPLEDPRMRGQPGLVAQTLVPDISLGAHTASLGLAFDEGNQLPGKYRGGAFIGQHGSWNSARQVGYKVVFVPFLNGRPSGPPQDFLTGFTTGQGLQVYGRPAGVAFTRSGGLLVADDAGNTVWLVTAD